MVDYNCDNCGDALHSFVDELEDGTKIYVVVCPTCYEYIQMVERLDGMSFYKSVFIPSPQT